MSNPTIPEIKKFIADALVDYGKDSIDIDTVFHGGPGGDMTFFGTTADDTSFEVILTVESIEDASWS